MFLKFHLSVSRGGSFIVMSGGGPSLKAPRIPGPILLPFSFLRSGAFTHSLLLTIYSEYTDLQLLLPSNVLSAQSPGLPRVPRGGLTSTAAPP